MRMYGVPREGKRVTLSDGLSLRIPFGVAYGKDEDGNYTILQYQTVPTGYRDGAFTVKDGEEVLWSISGLQKKAVMSFEAEDGAMTPASVQEAMRGKLQELAKGMVQEDNSSQEPYEPGSSTKVEETEGGFVIRSGISINAAGGSYDMLELSEKVAGAVAKKGFQLFGMTMYFTYLLLAVEDCPEAALFYATLKGAGEADFYEKTLTPLLKTAELETSRKTGAARKPRVERDAGPVAASLDFSKGERVRTGELSILVPGGMCWTPEISPETRYLSCVPASVTFDDPDWDEVSAVKFTLQTGQKIPAVQEALDSPAGEERVQALLQSMTVAQEGASGRIGQVVTVSRTPDAYICYEPAGETDVDCVFRYYIFSHVFVYTGMYVGWKAGLEDPVQRHRQILEKWLGTVQYEGGAEEELARYGKTQFGPYAAEDGRLNAVTVAQLFSTDVLFFNEDDFKEAGLKNGVHINSLKLAEHPFLAEKRDVLAPEIGALLLELDAVPELRVPKEKLHKKLIPLLFNENDVPLTGMTMMNLLAYHMLYIQENGPEDYAVAIDRNLVAGIPDAYRYAAAFLRRLRQYNGKDGAFTVTFTTAANFDTPIQGVMKPVAGAVQARSAYRLQVESSGAVQELEAADREDQPEAQRSIQELESMLPQEFTEKMRTFSGDVASRLSQLCRTLQESDYDGLPDTDAVLNRVMDQAGDYGLAWGIYNFYCIFTLGDTDRSFTYEKDGQRDISGSGFECPGYRVDEQYEDYAEGDPDFQPEEFPRQLAQRIGGITEEQVYRAILEQAADYQSKGYTIVDQERIRREEQKKTLKKVPFDRVSAVQISGKTFVLTGEFEHLHDDREAIKGKIQEKGGRCTQAISGKTNYLVIGGLGGFGERKLEQVKEQRAKGKQIEIIREEDLFAALEGRAAGGTVSQSSGKPAKKSAQPTKSAQVREEKAQTKAADQAQQEERARQKAAEQAKQEEQARKKAAEQAKRKERAARKAAEEKARLEKEQAEREAAERARQEELRVRRAKLARKCITIAALVLAALCALFGVKSYIDNAPYRELAADIDQGTFHYSSYIGQPGRMYFLWYDNSLKVIAGKLTDFHREDDIQAAVALIGSLPPDESILDYYIDGTGIYMTDSFRNWFAERVAEEGTVLSAGESTGEKEDLVMNLYQMGDFQVKIIYERSQEDSGQPRQALVCGPRAEDDWVTLGAGRSSRYYGEQYGIK